MLLPPPPLPTSRGQQAALGESPHRWDKMRLLFSSVTLVGILTVLAQAAVVSCYTPAAQVIWGVLEIHGQYGKTTKA